MQAALFRQTATNNNDAQQCHDSPVATPPLPQSPTFKAPGAKVTWSPSPLASASNDRTVPTLQRAQSATEDNTSLTTDIADDSVAAAAAPPLTKWSVHVTPDNNRITTRRIIRRDAPKYDGIGPTTPAGTPLALRTVRVNKLFAKMSA